MTNPQLNQADTGETEVQLYIPPIFEQTWWSHNEGVVISALRSLEFVSFPNSWFLWSHRAAMAISNGWFLHNTLKQPIISPTRFKLGRNWLFERCLCDGHLYVNRVHSKSPGGWRLQSLPFSHPNPLLSVRSPHVYLIPFPTKLQLDVW